MDNIGDMNNALVDNEEENEAKVKNKFAQLRLFILSATATRIYNLRRNRGLANDDELHSAWNDWIHIALLEIRRKLKVNYGIDRNLKNGDIL